MLGGFVANSVNAALEPVVSQTETFGGNGIGAPTPARVALVSFITVVIILALILFAGKWLWNNILLALVPGVKPAKSVWQILGLSILISLLAPGSCNCGGL
jgi:hypothetical protein